MNKLIVLGVSIILCQVALGASMNFKGSFRAQSSYYSNLSLGAAGVSEAPKSFIEGRALLRPNLIIDDHFSLHSQWSLLTSPNTTPNATQALGNGQGGYIFGDRNTQALTLSRAWLEWTSDFGVFRVGRMPISWGFGLLYDAGNNVWDDFQSTLDRIEYRLHLGNVVGALAYSKPRKVSVLGNENDSEFFTIYLQYDNPRLEVEGGLMYEKQARSSSQNDALMQQQTELGLPGAVRTPYPLTNNVLGAYARKTIKYFTFGGELSWLSGDATDYNQDGSDGGKDKLNAFAFLFAATYEVHKIKAFAEFLYATGDSDLNNNQLDGFVLLNRNRRAGLILGQELLGALHTNSVGSGSLVAYSGANSFSGVLLIRPGLRINWSPTLATGIEVIIAKKAAAGSGEEKSLGVELDLGLDYAVYKNCMFGLNLGYLFAGDGLGVSNAKNPFAVRATFAVDI